jgi:hypothetical protein
MTAAVLDRDRIASLAVDAQIDHWARTVSRTTPDPLPLAEHVTAYLARHGLHVTAVRLTP